MLRIERIEQYVREQSGDNGVTASEVAQALHIWRSDASAGLNQLEKAGVLKRTHTRPVRFSLQSVLDTSDGHESCYTSVPFPDMIGSQGSLLLQVQLAQAAAIYPPCGMHTLIIGETGVGKSLMAEEIWKYLCQNRKTNEQVPFVSFNCAEYAENPQLLLSQLFGYEKGAFTGATQAHDGLIEQSRNGILFLDEMHRLPATGQEMFFTVIDKGIYRRLGSSEDRSIQLMIIGATTEDPNSSFLTTFRRRFPMLIQIPSLVERPLCERIQLVKYFLVQEAKRLNLSIRISREALKLMVAYRGEGNIGELRNNIQICCAKGYQEYCLDHLYSPEQVSTIYINVSCLPRQMVSATQPDIELEQYFSTIFHLNEIVLHPNMSANIQDCLPTISNHHLNSDFSSSFGSISTNVWHLVSDILHSAPNELHLPCGKDIHLSVAFFLQQTQFYARAGSTYHVATPTLSETPSDAMLAFCRQLRGKIQSELGVALMEQECVALALLLERYTIQQKAPRAHLLIANHGDSIASGIAHFCNELLNCNIAIGIDLPISESESVFFEQLGSTIRMLVQEDGIILLTEVTACLSRKTEISSLSERIFVLPFVNSILALELCKSILTTNDSLGKIIQNAVLEFRKYSSRMLQIGSQISTNAELTSIESEKSVIITLCITGNGSAHAAQDYLMRIPEISQSAEVISLSMFDNIDTISPSLRRRLKLVVGFTDPKIPGIPFVGIETLFTQSGLNRIIILLHQWSSIGNHMGISDDITGSLNQRLEIVKDNVSRFAPSFRPQEVAGEILYILHAICDNCTDPMEDSRIIRLYIHIAAMLERIYNIQHFHLPQDELPERSSQLIADNRELFIQIKRVLSDSCIRLGLPVVESEVYYLMVSLPQFDDIWENSGKD